MNYMHNPPKNLLPVFLLDILDKKTDEDHRLSQEQIRQILKDDYQMEANRKTLRRTMEQLADLDIGIQYDVVEKRTPVRKKNKETGKMETLKDPETGGPLLKTIENWENYYLIHPFERSEIRLIVDALLFCGFVPKRQYIDLAERLSALAGPNFKAHVRHIYCLPEGKAENPELFLNIELLDEAIHKGVKVSFDTLERGPDKKLRQKSSASGDKGMTTVSPYQLAVQDGHYYVLCCFGPMEFFHEFRVERISNVKIHEDQPVRPFDELDLKFAEYLDLRKYLKGPRSVLAGKNVYARFRINTRMVDEVLETFGEDLDFSDTTDTGTIMNFTTVSGKVNRFQLMHFARKMGSQVKILEPENLVESMRKWSRSMEMSYRERKKKE